MESPSSSSAVINVSSRILSMTYRFMGLEPAVIRRMPYRNKNTALRLVMAGAALSYLVFVSFYLFLLIIFPESFALNTALSLIIACFFMLLFAASNSGYLSQSYMDSGLVYRFYGWKKFTHVSIYMFTVCIFLAIASLLLSVALSKEQVSNAYKKDAYEKENTQFLKDIDQINAESRSRKTGDIKELGKLYDGYKSLNQQQGSYTSLFDSLQFQQKQNYIKLSLYKIKKNEASDTGTIVINPVKPDDVDYVVSIDKGLIQMNADSLGQFNGISFKAGNNIDIIANYNDSIYIISQEISIIGELLKGYMSRTDNFTARYDFREAMLRSSLVSTNLYEAATKNWLKRLMKIENGKMTISATFQYFSKLYFRGNTSVLARTLFIFIIVAAVYIYLVVRLIRLKNSPYPRQVYYYRKSQEINLGQYVEKLEEKSTILNEITNVSENENTEDLKKTLSMIKDDGSFDSYMGFANYYMQRKEYSNSIKWLEDGYNKFYSMPEYRKKSLDFLNCMADIHSLAGDSEKSEEKRDLYYTELNEITINENLVKKIKLDQFEVVNHKFYDKCAWKFQPGINVLLGKNGFGKSHLICILLSMLQNDRRQAKKIVEGNERHRGFEKSVFTVKVTDDQEIKLSDLQEVTFKVEMEKFEKNLREEQDTNLRNEEGHNEADFERLVKIAIDNKRVEITRSLNEEKMCIQYAADGIDSDYGKIPVLAIPDTRFIDKSASQISNNTHEVDLTTDGAKHFIYQLPFSPIIENFYYDACSEIYQKQQHAFGQETEDPPSIGLIKDIYKRLTGVAITKLEVVKHTLAVYEMYVSTDELIDYLPIQKVSQGTFSIIAILGIIQSYLKLVYGNKVAPEQLKNQTAIVIIDELDAHLHPSWQQKIINILRETFPNIQFIITAHSPFIVAGCSEMEVAILQKDVSSKKFSIAQFNQHFIGYSPDELCKLVFDIEKYDENFYTYVNQTPRKKEIDIQLLELKKKTTLKTQEKESLDQLQYELYRILKAENRLKEQAVAVTNP